ncbi:choline dehydrogenase [Elsinoe ampelina]|uniref:Choline dehydrogenase n=1 Tax=Elsinoe ampelina TaxID=302913 RepID=A0A6A6GQN3_9PEZI|nr:choline dehydrogenase [Elsinoe ampelina]
MKGEELPDRGHFVTPHVRIVDDLLLRIYLSTPSCAVELRGTHTASHRRSQGSLCAEVLTGLETTWMKRIIVGGGTAGIALATRLSQRLPNDRILLLEAGPTVLDDPRINIPGRKGSALGTVYDWNWTTTPQEAANGRTVAVNRGKVLGGTSAINLLCWDRASVADYDAWEAIGNPGWNWKNMIDAMLKVENFTGINTETYASEGVGVGGPIDTVINRIQPTQQTYWLPTLKSLGISGNLNSLNGNPLGVELQPSNIDPTGYIRKYSTNSYLPEAGPNLEVRDQTLVNKILFTRRHHKLRATAVSLSTNQTISAKKEIILSAGTIQSPGLLEPSGIGSPSILNPLSIPLLHPLPGVGANLQDHVRITASYQLKQNYTSFDALRVNATFAAEQLALYNASLPSLYDFTGSAYLFATWPQVLPKDTTARLTALANTTFSSSPSPVIRRKLAYLLDPAGIGAATTPQLEIIFSDGYTGVTGYPAPSSPLYGQGFSTLIAGLQHPFSEGSVHVNSTVADAAPLIDPNYLSNEYEIQALVEIVKFMREVAGTYPLAQAWEGEYEPGPEVVGDEAVRDYVKRTVASLYHPVGTCGMMPLEDGGVVDPELKVYGTEGLRVVDASVMPILVPGHIQTAVYGIAERAADLIVGEWGGK